MKQETVIIVVLLTLFFLIVGGLIATQHYFHTQEIESLIKKCEANNGTPDLHIDNTITKHYNFRCIMSEE